MCSTDAAAGGGRRCGGKYQDPNCIAQRFKRGKTNSSRTSAVLPPPPPECKATERPSTNFGRRKEGRKGKEEHNGGKILTDGRRGQITVFAQGTQQISIHSINLQVRATSKRLRELYADAPRNLMEAKWTQNVHDVHVCPVLSLPLSFSSVVCHRCVNISIDRSTASFVPSFLRLRSAFAQNFLFFSFSFFSDSCVNNSKSASHSAKTTLCCQSGHGTEFGRV